MGKKIALNVLYNVGIVVCLFEGYLFYVNKHYTYVAIAAITAAILIVLKLRLIKQIRGMNRKP